LRKKKKYGAASSRRRETTSGDGREKGGRSPRPSLRENSWSILLGVAASTAVARDRNMLETKKKGGLRGGNQQVAGAINEKMSGVELLGKQVDKQGRVSDESRRKEHAAELA